MKKNLLLAFALAASTLLGITGCGDDPPTVTVDPKFEYKSGQTFTYESTPRDSVNNPESAKMETVTWVVLDTGLTYPATGPTKTGVTRIQQTRGTGATAVTDTLYFAVQSNGEFYQYNLIGSVVGRIPLAAQVGIQNLIPKAWTKIGDTKNSNALSYNATVESIVNVDVPLPTGSTLPVQVTYSVRGQHNGDTVVTVPLKTSNKAFSTDLIVNLKATAFGGNVTVTNDSLRLNYTMDVTDGILSHSLTSKTISFLNPAVTPPAQQPQTILGFDMKLKSRTP